MRPGKRETRYRRRPRSDADATDLNPLGPVNSVFDSLVNPDPAPDPPDDFSSAFDEGGSGGGGGGSDFGGDSGGDGGGGGD